MNYLTAEQVLFIHARVVTETGGSHGVRDLGLLKSAIARPQATYESQELYSDVFWKAAALMDALVNNHPFVDGNKRTGVAAAAVFLTRNGWRLNADVDDLEKQTLKLAAEGMEMEELAAWLQANSKQES